MKRILSALPLTFLIITNTSAQNICGSELNLEAI